MGFMDLWRVMVKVGNRYTAVIYDSATGAICTGGNKIHHSFFPKEDAIKLRDELQAAGFEAKISR
jgi:hypothetical protein